MHLKIRVKLNKRDLVRHRLVLILKVHALANTNKAILILLIQLLALLVIDQTPIPISEQMSRLINRVIINIYMMITAVTTLSMSLTTMTTATSSLREDSQVKASARCL